MMICWNLWYGEIAYRIGHSTNAPSVSIYVEAVDGMAVDGMGEE